MDNKPQFDSLSLYHHLSSFNGKLGQLASLLEMPKEYKLPQRFAAIEALLNRPFSLGVLQHLKLLDKVAEAGGLDTLRPELLLHLFCLLGCTDSIEYIAGYLGLTLEEVRELYRELHHTFSIESLISRIREYYKQNKQLHDEAEFHQHHELLGMEPSLEPRDTAENRKQRLRRRYGHFDINLESHNQS